MDRPEPPPPPVRSAADDDDDVDPDLNLARAGDAQALDRLLRRAEPLAMRLALRMLGRHEDAREATQEVLLRVATHLDSFRGDSRFSTWVYRIAANTVTDALRAQRSARVRGLTAVASDIEAGIDSVPEALAAVDAVTPEHRVAATELALVCTQGMLMALEPGQRLAYVLGEVMGFEGETAALIAGVSHEAFRQRLLRARGALRDFVDAHCGLVSPRARCHCDRQLRALPPARVAWLASQPLSRGQAVPLLQDITVRQGLRDIGRLQTVAQLMRAHPLPEGATAHDLVQRVREQLAATVFGGSGPKAPPA